MSVLLAYIQRHADFVQKIPLRVVFSFNSLLSVGYRGETYSLVFDKFQCGGGKPGRTIKRVFFQRVARGNKGESDHSSVLVSLQAQHDMTEKTVAIHWGTYMFSETKFSLNMTKWVCWYEQNSETVELNRRGKEAIWANSGAKDHNKVIEKIIFRQLQDLVCTWEMKRQAKI